jgi:putative ABC transport system permease protein
VNDRRVVLKGICKASAPFTTLPVLYSRFTEIERFLPANRNVMNFILAKPTAGSDPQEVCQAIEQNCGLMALTQDGFFWKTIEYFMVSTGIPINFGITVGLGFLVGTAIAGQTFYLFIVENLRQFGALKAMGTGNGTILLMVLAQALHVGLVGLGVGVGLAALFGWSTRSFSKLSFYMPWQVLVITGVAVFLIVLLASLLSIRRVFIVDPAIVFRG